MISTARSLSDFTDHLTGNEPGLAAYNRLLPLELTQPTRVIRLLGQMLIQAPTEDGRSYVAREINECKTDADVVNLSQFFMDYFVKYFRARSKSHTPTPHSSLPSFEELRQQISQMPVPAPSQHLMAKRMALYRDGFRCTLSGVVDTKSLVGEVPEAVAALQTSGGDSRATECCHILPQHIGHGLGDEEQREYASRVLAVANLFGGIPTDFLNARHMNDLKNVMTMESGVHTAFGNLEIWLESVLGQDNTYMIRKRYPFIFIDLPETVTFQSTRPELSLPDPHLLAFHAACARIAKLSGAAEYLEQLLDDEEEIGVLAQDGSSGSLLAELLTWRSSAVY